MGPSQRVSTRKGLGGPPAPHAAQWPEARPHRGQIKGGQSQELSWWAIPAGDLCPEQRMAKARRDTVTKQPYKLALRSRARPVVRMTPSGLGPWLL